MCYRMRHLIGVHFSVLDSELKKIVKKLALFFAVD